MHQRSEDDAKDDVTSVASHCRLFVYLARDVPRAVVLRCGPSDWARLSCWQTDTDTFEHGQWIKARVYERRSDLSADGALFLAFVRQSGRTLIGPSDRDTWLALSRPPWFTALAYWLIGGTYHTGGYFPAPNTLWPSFGGDPPDDGTLPAWLEIAQGHPPYVDGTPNWTERTVWLNRLLRDGWRRLAARLTLTMALRSEADFGAYGGPHVVEYAVRDEAGAAVPLGRADWDHRGRLRHWQWPGSWQEIADFNEQAPAPAPAPEWAREWPVPPSDAMFGCSGEGPSPCPPQPPRLVQLTSRPRR